MTDNSDLTPQIRELHGLIAEIGTLAEASVNQAVDALVRQDSILANLIIQSDAKIDELELRIDQFAIRLFAQGLPEGAALLDVVTALKISTELSRIGEFSKAIANSVNQIKRQNYFEPLTLISAMAELVQKMARDSTNAFITHDLKLADNVIVREPKLNEHYNLIFRDLVTYMTTRPSTISSAAKLLDVARNLERIGDHSGNIAELVHYSLTGHHSPDSTIDN